MTQTKQYKGHSHHLDVCHQVQDGSAHLDQREASTVQYSKRCPHLEQTQLSVSSHLTNVQRNPRPFPSRVSLLPNKGPSSQERLVQTQNLTPAKSMFRTLP